MSKKKIKESEDRLTLKSLGKTSVGWPRITNSRELSLRRLESKSSRLCSKNLEDDRKKDRVVSDNIQLNGKIMAQFQEPSWGRSWKNGQYCYVQWVGRENCCSGFEKTWRSSFNSVCSLICRWMQVYPDDLLSEITYCCIHNMELKPDVPNDLFPRPFNGSSNLVQFPSLRMSHYLVLEPFEPVNNILCI